VQIHNHILDSVVTKSLSAKAHEPRDIALAGPAPRYAPSILSSILDRTSNVLLGDRPITNF